MFNLIYTRLLNTIDTLYCKYIGKTVTNIEEHSSVVIDIYCDNI